MVPRILGHRGEQQGKMDNSRFDLGGVLNTSPNSLGAVVSRSSCEVSPIKLPPWVGNHEGNRHPVL